MPPIRELARELAMSPTTVSAAWSVLTKAGTLVTAGRRGTFVADVLNPRDGRYRQALAHQATFEIDLSTGVPDAALLPSLTPALRELTSAGTPASYLDDPVLPELRQYLLSAWPYEASDLTVVDGAMDALELVIRSNLRVGDRVLVENPTFPPLVDLLEAAGLTIVPVDIDDEGLSEVALAAALAVPAQALFIQPRAQNPTGVSLSQSRIAALTRILGKQSLLIVEDDSAAAISSAGDLTLGRELPDHTVHIRSYSKSHGPDLRLAAVSGPSTVIADIQHLRHLGQGWSSRLLQRILLTLLQDPVADAAVTRARREYSRRRAVLVDALNAAGVPTIGSDGLNVWVPVHDEAAAIMRLALNGIAVAPGQPFLLGQVKEPHLRITTGLMNAQAEQVSELIAIAARTSERTGLGR